jgi:4-hydroxy-2-oxoglutarate aldolase
MGSLSLSAPRVFPPGVHVPSLTWFADDKQQEIDWEIQTKHLEFLVGSGLHGSKLEEIINDSIY